MDVRERRWLLIGLIVEAAILSFLVREIRVLPDGKLHVHVLDVGQGDSILLVSPTGKQVLIDGGPGDQVLQPLAAHLSFFDRSLDLVVMTHPDHDHSGGLPAVLRHYQVKALLLTGLKKKETAYDDLLALTRTKNITTVIADPAQDIGLGDGVTLDLVWPPPIYVGKDVEKANDTSIVLRVLFGTGSLLLTGDIEAEAEHNILSTSADLRADILKVPHHGSKTSSSTGFLLAIDPHLAVISVAKKNGYGHPHPTVLERYHQFDIPVRTTAQEGTISLTLPP